MPPSPPRFVFRSVENTSTSDHKPVIASFKASTSSFGPSFIEAYNQQNMPIQQGIRIMVGSNPLQLQI